MKSRIVKVVSWRIVSVTITILVMWLFTGNVREATGLTLFLHALLTIANYLFEMFWERINGDR